MPWQRGGEHHWLGQRFGGQRDGDFQVTHFYLQECHTTHTTQTHTHTHTANHWLALLLLGLGLSYANPSDCSQIVNVLPPSSILPDDLGQGQGCFSHNSYCLLAMSPPICCCRVWNTKIQTITSDPLTMTS